MNTGRGKRHLQLKEVNSKPESLIESYRWKENSGHLAISSDPYSELRTSKRVPGGCNTRLTLLRGSLRGSFTSVITYVWYYHLGDD